MPTRLRASFRVKRDNEGRKPISTEGNLQKKRDEAMQRRLPPGPRFYQPRLNCSPRGFRVLDRYTCPDTRSS